MTPTVFVPHLVRGKMALNAAGLCEFHQLVKEEDVPVERFRICAGRTEVDVCVGPKQYKTALLLFHLMVGSPNNAPSFYVTRAMQAESVYPYYDDVSRSPDAPTTFTDTNFGRLLLGSSVCVALTLKPGYQRHLAAFRTPEEVVNFAWAYRDTLDFGSPLGMLRRSLAWFFEQTERTEKNPSGLELDPEFSGKILFLQQRLNANTMSAMPIRS